MAFIGIILAAVGILLIILGIIFLFGLGLLITGLIIRKINKIRKIEKKSKLQIVLIVVGIIAMLPFTVIMTKITIEAINIKIEENNSITYQVTNGTVEGIDKIISKNNNINLTYEYEKIKDCTGLHQLCSAKDVEDREGKLEYFFEKKADVNMQNEMGYTPLILLCKNNHIDEETMLSIAKKLIENGADIKIIDKKGCDAIDYAYKHDNIAVMKLLREKYNKSEKNILSYCIKNGSALDVEKVLKTGVSPYSKMSVQDLNISINESSYSYKYEDLPIYYIANNRALKDRKEKVKLLVKYGLDINMALGETSEDYHEDGSKDVYKDTLLHYACTTLDTDMIEILVELDADLNQFDKEYGTPLYRACNVRCNSREDILKQIKAVQLLIDAGADCHAKHTIYFSAYEQVKFLEKNYLLEIMEGRK